MSRQVGLLIAHLLKAISVSAHFIEQRQILLALHLIALKFTVFLDDSKLCIFVLCIQILDLSLEILNTFF